MHVYKLHCTFGEPRREAQFEFSYLSTKLAAIDPSAVGTDLSLGWIRQRLNVAHVDHGLRKILEEGILAGRELVDDRRRGALRLG